MAPQPGISSDSPTRQKLIRAGFRLFGDLGYAGASTRKLAEAAGTNVASIAYHFGSKAGLLEACARSVTERVGAVVGRPEDHGGLDPEEAAARLDTMLRALARFLIASDDARDMVAFMLREVNASGAMLHLVHDDFIGPKHRELCALWATATGRDADSEEVALAVFAMVGQVIYFRVGQPIVLRRLGWETIDPVRAERIADILSDHLRAAIDRSRS
ncbi:CerR family C-terminal domain-containing protein [Salipiger sp.]|uniref:CerR family C-terminal domain-containing protein n=1 Tax=Salipiger sp. TaxID=2078585 RepID=UPI003A98572A